MIASSGSDGATAAPAPTPAGGLVCTFYSYKGGVGRSMALANVAALLSQMGRRVLIVDWDLEAPGIEKYFEHVGGRRTLAGKRKTTPGIVDLVQAFSAGRKLPWKESLLSAEVFPGKPPVSILTSGRDDAEYSARLRAIAWEKLFAAHGFGDYLEQLRDEWTAAFDLVLVDSRTGITDIGGICTIHLPDVVVAMFTANEQSLIGTKNVVESVFAARDELAVGRYRLRVVPLPARDESLTEHEQAKEWRARFAVELDAIYRQWLPAGVETAEVLETLKIPYKPYWSFGERLPAVLEGTRDPGGLGRAYLVLARLLDSRLDWGYALGEGTAVAVAEQRAREADRRVHEVQQRSRTWVRSLVAALVVVAVIAGVWVVNRGRAMERERRERILHAAATSTDPLEATLLLGELDGAPEPSGGLAKARTILSAPIPAEIWRREPGTLRWAAFSPDGHAVIFNARPGVLSLCSTDSANSAGATPTDRIPKLLEGMGELTMARFSPDGTQVVAGSQDGTVRVWEIGGKSPEVSAALPHNDPIASVRISFDGHWLATATRKEVLLSELRTPTPRRFSWPIDAADLQFTRDGRFLLAGQYGLPPTRLTLPKARSTEPFDLKASVEKFSADHPEPVEFTEGSNDGTFIGTITRKELLVWRVDTVKPPLLRIGLSEILPKNVSPTTSIASFDIAPGTLALGMKDGTVAVVWDPDLTAISGGTGAVRGQKAAAAPAVRILGKPVAGVADLQLDSPRYKAGRPPGQLACAFTDGTFKLWSLTGYQPGVIWSLEGGAPVTFRTGGEPAIAVRFDDQGHWLLGVTEKAVYLWPLARPKLSETWEGLTHQARQLTAACLTADQRVRLLQEQPDVATTAFDTCERAHGRASKPASAPR